jgi:hypothetical protein
VNQVTPDMYAILDSLIDEAAVSLPAYPANLPSDQAVRFAEGAFNQIDCILLRHGFVFPGHGLVQLLSDGLAPTIYDDPLDLIELANQRHNRRRSAFIHAHGAGPFYVVDCDIASFVFLGIAQARGYPVHLVDIPAHNFVRWDIGGGTFVDYETMSGTVTNDVYYREHWDIPDRFAIIGGTLRSMDEIEAFAYHDGVLAMAWAWRHDYKQMIDYDLRAISRDPTRSFSSSNLAWYYAAGSRRNARDGTLAIKYAKLAVSLFPDGDNLDTLACAYAQSGDFDNARATEAEAGIAAYTPFGSGIAYDMALFMGDRICDDPGFDTDPQPFRPRPRAPQMATDKEAFGR